MITQKRLLNLLNILYVQEKSFYDLISSFIVIATNNEKEYENKEYELSDLENIVKNMNKEEIVKFDKLVFDYLLDLESPNSIYSKIQKYNPEMKLEFAEFYEVFGLKTDRKTIDERLEKFYEKEFYKVKENTFISSFHLLSEIIYNRLNYGKRHSDLLGTYKKQIENVFKNGLMLLDKKSKNNPELKDKIYKVIATDLKYYKYSRLEQIIIPIMKEREDFKKYIR